MNCKEWEDRIALYAGSDLPAAAGALVEQHLEECLGCQLFASGLREAQAFLAECHEEVPDEAHFAAVRARVVAKLERQRVPWWQRGWGYGFAAVAALVVLLLAGKVPTADVPSPQVAMAHPPAPPLVAPVRAKVPEAGRAAAKGFAGEPVLIRIVSNDPDVVIYWIAETKGE
ncbi:MAG TPA: zf-HC2 domain-containing protein [Bryobacteraceae bacterium]|nr:zf-HC2 domain-containing protein [Bryobacteraceae bacterium]